jgi:hypothetical protein
VCSPCRSDGWLPRTGAAQAGTPRSARRSSRAEPGSPRTSPPRSCGPSRRRPPGARACPPPPAALFRRGTTLGSRASAAALARARRHQHAIRAQGVTAGTGHPRRTPRPFHRQVRCRHKREREPRRLSFCLHRHNQV